MQRVLTLFSLLLLSFFAACGDFTYYSQSVSGHLSMMARRQPIADILQDSSTPEPLRRELGRVLAIRDFASVSLQLPVKESFSSYADLERPFAVWNVVAAPRYSLAALEWCFPVTGCLPYRGYFDKSDARRFAAALERRGLDAHVYGVPAYSTLGLFSDPVLNTFVNYPEWALAGLVFHELAHQVVYVKGDGDFNEAFASAVEIEGVKRWLAAQGKGGEQDLYQQYQQREDLFAGLLTSTRRELLDCYDGRHNLSRQEAQACRETAFASMRKRYHLLREGWGGYSGYDSWFAGGLNNARFVSVQTYRYYIPAFLELLRQENGDLSRFYIAVRTLAGLPGGERQLALKKLRESAGTVKSALSDAPRSAVDGAPLQSGI